MPILPGQEPPKPNVEHSIQRQFIKNGVLHIITAGYTYTISCDDVSKTGGLTPPTAPAKDEPVSGGEVTKGN